MSTGVYTAEELAQLAESSEYQHEFQAAVDGPETDVLTSPVNEKDTAETRSWQISVVDQEAQAAEKRKMRNHIITAVLVVVVLVVVFVFVLRKKR